MGTKRVFPALVEQTAFGWGTRHPSGRLWPGNCAESGCRTVEMPCEQASAKTGS